MTYVPSEYGVWLLNGSSWNRHELISVGFLFAVGLIASASELAAVLMVGDPNGAAGSAYCAFLALASAVTGGFSAAAFRTSLER